MSMAGFIFSLVFKHSMCIWGKQTVPCQTVLLTAGRSHPPSQFHINPAWSVFPAPERVHLAPYTASWQGYLVPFPVLSLGKSNRLPPDSRWSASPLLWVRLGHPAQLHTSERNSCRLLCAFYKSTKNPSCDPLQIAVGCVQSLTCRGAGSKPHAVVLPKPATVEKVGYRVRIRRGSDLLFQKVK